MIALPMIAALSWANPPPLQVDLHLDTPTQLLRQETGLEGAELEAGLAQLKAGGTNVAVQVLWPPRNSDHHAHALHLLELLEAEESRLDGVTRVHTPEEARAVVAQGGIATLLSLEGAHGLGGDAWRENLQALHRRGLRLLGLTWSFSNRFAGSSGDGGGGLTEEGRELVAMAQGLGIIIDLSHASEQTTLEVCRQSTLPVIASHSNAASLAPHSRNLSDEAIQCIAARGGVIGLNFHATFVGRGKDIQALADHADHLRQVGGPGVVALGSDFDGLIRPVRGLENASRIPALLEALRQRGWSEAEVQGLQGRNFLETWEMATASP